MSRLKVVSSMKEVKQLINACIQMKFCSFDFETTGLEYYEKHKKPLVLGVSFQAGSSWVIPLAHKDSCFHKNNQWKKVLRLFGKKVLENWDVVKVAWNFKFEYKWCKRYNIIAKGRLFDAQLAKYCLDEERPNDLKSWVDKLYPQYGGYEDMINKGKNAVPWSEKPLDDLCTYCGIDADLTGRLMTYFEVRLIKLGFYNLFRNLLMMEMRVLAESEYEGMVIDREYLVNLMEEYVIKLREAKNKLDNQKVLIKFNRRMHKYNLSNLIKKVELEIAQIDEEGKPNAQRLIKNREDKITKYLSGIFNKKEQELLTDINWNSPAQVAAFFYRETEYEVIDKKNGPTGIIKKSGSKFGLGMKPKVFTDTGAPSTSEDALEAIRSQDKTGFIDALLEYRGIEHLNKIYVVGIYNLLGSDDRVHANYKIFGTVTGRLSCEEPNMQNIPRGTTAADIKKMFIPPKGYILVEVDYSQAELRVVAELAKDVNMIDIFRRNYNIHVATACMINGGIHLYDKVKSILKDDKHKDWLFWEKQKKRAKTINFGILYGQTEKKLSIELECTESEAKKFIKKWYSAYPQVAKWIKEQKKFAHKHGYVKSLFGRKRRLHNIYSEKYGVMLEAERQAVNTPIQGTASDFGLLSSIVIREMKMKGELPSDMQQAYTVHDSIGYYIKPDDVHRVLPIIIKVCDNPNTLQYFGFEMKEVKMKVSPEICFPTWFDKHEYDPWTNYNKMVNDYWANRAA